MAGKRNNNRKRKHCPLIDAECIEGDCMLYHEEFERCKFDVLAYNLYILTAELRKRSDD